MVSDEAVYCSRESFYTGVLSIFPLSSACSAERESVNITVFVMQDGFVSNVWCICVIALCMANCSAI